LDWNPRGYRRRGRPKRTWRRTTEDEIRKLHWIGILRGIEEKVGRKRMWQRTTEDEI